MGRDASAGIKIRYISGGCQCGDVQYRVKVPFITQYVCHCHECQKYTSSAYGMTALCHQKDFHILKGELKIWSRKGHSGALQECYFCPRCGNRIYHKSSSQPDIIRLKPGTLDDTQDLAPRTHLWTSCKQSWVELPDSVKTHPTQPDF